MEGKINGMPSHLQKAEDTVKALRQSFNSGKTKSYEWREAQIKGIIRFIEEKKKEIEEALYCDIEKPNTETFVHEISLAKKACVFSLDNLKKWMQPEKVSTSITTWPSSAKIVSEPLGVVLVISAWNYPFLLSIEPVIGAIIAGNAVVLKPSELAPATSELFAKLLPEYVDNSCIKVIEGAVPETTALLQQKWDKIFYTGNGRVGRIVMEAAAKHLTPVSLELGGKCPALMDSHIDLTVAVKRLAVGKWGCNNGQACIAPDYIITTKSFAPQLVEELKITLKRFYGEHPLESADLSRVINSRHYNRLTDLLDDEKVSNTIVFGGQRDEKKLRIAPTLLLDPPLDSLIMKEEIFGPLLPIITVDKLEDGFELINKFPKPLAAYCFTKDKTLQEKFIQTVSAGGILINDCALHLTNPELPFGGVGESGMGAYHGKFSFDDFSHRKGALSRTFFGEVKARYPPYTLEKQWILRGVIEGKYWATFCALFGLGH